MDGLLVLAPLREQNAEFQPLADSGGPTMTHAIGFTSVARNNGNPGGCTDYDANLLPADQRYAIRTNRCDLGAYEFGPIPPIFLGNFESEDTGLWSARTY